MSPPALAPAPVTTAFPHAPMPRPLCDSEYLYGFHDPGGEHLMLERGVPGWVLVTEELHSDPNDQTGRDYRSLSDRGLGVMARLNAGYGGVGTLPREAEHANFARRCANFVRSSSGCRIWIVGNEPNHPIEWPGGPSGEPITPQRYARCYRMVRDAIRSVPGHADDQVVVAATAPWNAQLTYPGNKSGDWVQYFQDVLALVGPEHCDAISIHAYTHGSSTALITSETRMSSFPNRRFEFRVYRDFMGAIPSAMRQLPVYITETDQDAEWLNANTGWVRAAYAEIDDWNKHHAQKIRSLLLYRWPKIDKWYIEGKQGIVEDFRQALDFRYKWQVGPTKDPPELPAARARFSLAVALKECQAGQQISLPMVIRNQGSDTWSHTGASSVRMGYRWLDAAGKQVAGMADIRTSLPQPVRTNEEVRITATIAAPPTAGTFTLVLDMVTEPNQWFAAAGNTPATVPVTVTAAGEDEQYFPETKVWVRGAFLDFYRRYGVEICGFPIAEAAAEDDFPSQYFQRVALEQAEPGKVRLKLIAQQVLASRQRIAELEAQVQDLLKHAPPGAAPKPGFQDITNRLPRDAARLFIRQDSDVQTIIIHHTGVAAYAAVDRVAAIYRQRDYPAIIGQFYIDYDGTIYQTNGLNEVVSGQLAWAKNGMSIVMAGNFSQGVPSEAQMQSLAALCAWLLDAYHLDNAAVKGVSEGFARTQSPGTNWLGGSRWKDALLQRIGPLRGQPAVDQQAALQALTQERDRLTTELAAAREQNAVLQAALQKALEAQPRSAAKPPVQDIVAGLPRDAARLVKRPSGDVKYIVINHTGVPADYGPERLAQAHRVRWPAIVGQYFIAADGAVLQTNAEDEVVDDKQEWLYRAVNIFVAGNFDVDVPTEPQVNSLAALVLWLQQQHRLDDGAVRGVSEFIITRSPGEQWQAGKNWKKTLLDRVAVLRTSYQAAPAVDTAALALMDVMRRQIVELRARDQELDRQVDEYRYRAVAGATEVETLQAQLAALQDANQKLTSDRAQLNETILRQNATIATLQAQLGDLRKQQAAPADTTTPGQVVKPPMQELVNTLVKSTTGAYDSRSLAQISHICVHHSAAPASITPERIAEYHVNTHGWPGIGYHYYIGPDGVIYHTQDLSLISYHVYMNNSYTVGVCLAGDFTDVGPTPAQVNAAGKLIAWLMQELHIPITNVWGHKEFPQNATACPGRQWLEGLHWKQSLLSSIAAASGDPAPAAGKAIEHYVLFWQHPDGAWALQDWQGAINYVARFRPTTGFSLDDARQAKNVTIIGGTGGVSQKDEDALRAAGCKVERLAGRDYAETKAILDRLAQSGKPYLSLS